MNNNFDPWEALQNEHEKYDVLKSLIVEAITLIEDDRPNRAKRLLISSLEGEVQRRLNEHL